MLFRYGYGLLQLRHQAVCGLFGFFCPFHKSLNVRLYFRKESVFAVSYHPKVAFEYYLVFSSTLSMSVSNLLRTFFSQAGTYSFRRF